MVLHNITFSLGQTECVGRPNPGGQLSPAEKQLLEQIAEQLLHDYSDTLKKLGDE
jgi:hypothetical protein